MDPIEFLNQLELASPSASFLKNVGNGFENDDLKIDEEQAFINERTIVSFVANVSPTARQDVLDSTLLASLAAEKKHPDNSNPKGWYEIYTNVLTNIGWVPTQNEQRDYTAREREFDVDQAVVEIMTSIVGGPVAQVVLIKKTLEALQNLADDDGKIRVFEARAKSLHTSNFQVGMVTEDDGAVSINVSNFVFESIDGQRKVLFFRWGHNQAGLNYQFFKASLNAGVYSGIRFLVQQKLGKNPAAFIGELDI